MTTKNSKKRSNSETVEQPKSVDQSPPKKQKKQKPVEKPEVTNGDNEGVKLTAKQRKRLNTKNRQLAAIARIKEEGGIPKPLHAGKKDKKLKGNNENSAQLSQVKQDPKKVEAQLKAKQEKRAESKQLRKEKRQQDGQYKPDQVKLSADEIRLRIAEIKERPTITKTAKRKLGVLLKKLAVEEGTAVAANNKDKTQNGDGDNNSALSKSAKRRIRRENKGGDGDEEGNDSSQGDDDEGKEKPVDIQVFQKKKKQKIVATKNVIQNQKIVDKVSEVKTVEKINKNENKKGQKKGNAATKKIVEQKIDEVEEKEEEEEEEEEEDEAEDDDDEESEDDDDEEAEEEEEEEEESEDEVTAHEEEDEEESSEEAEDEEEETVAEPEKEKIAAAKVKKVEGKGKKEVGAQEENSDKKKRYILFVGNMPYTAKVDDVKQHFLTKVSEVSSVRIPTKPGTQTPRGFGYVEVTNDVDYEKALSLHHSFLNGRRINVEYTTSGSKPVSKRPDVVAKNQKLHALRKAGKLAGSQKHDQKRSVRRFKKKEQERTPK